MVWINFARNGIPSADGLPEWEPYTREGGATMILDTEPELVYHHDQALMELLAPGYTCLLYTSFAAEAAANTEA